MNYSQGITPAGAEVPTDAGDSLKTLLSQVVSVLGRRLDLPEYGPDDDFFASGGTSFLAALCSSDLRKLGISVAIQDLFVAKTPRALAEQINQKQEVS
ncbi:phosphopantetheine-binding protein [Streptomyces apocyni]|uniref:phosphopantetheine-binding protein n=1 Tax=Streptomyces apocyni TaxID=2654677 RepID=UPI0012EAB1FD|nr:phosphopantetheine-binding protein [Streptomyces apocyni]